MKKDTVNIKQSGLSRVRHHGSCLSNIPYSAASADGLIKACKRRFEIEILDQVCNEYGHKTGQQLIDLTHETIPFRATPHNSEIRYGLARYLDYEPFSAADVQRIADRDRANVVEALAYAADHPVGT